MKKHRRTVFVLLLAMMTGIFSGCGNASDVEGSAQPLKVEEVLSVAEDGVVLSDDASDFVLLSEAVPDAILEIRYYSTYNFVGDRIDGYEEPLACSRPLV